MKRQVPGVFSGPGELSQIAGRTASPPAHDLVYFGSADHFLYSYDPHNGEREQLAEASDEITCMTMSGGILYCGTQDDRLYSYEPAAKKLDVVAKATGLVCCVAAASDGNLYFGDRVGWLHSYNPATHKRRPRIMKAERGVSCISEIDGALYLGSLDGNMYSCSLTASNGGKIRKRKVAKAPSQIRCAVALEPAGMIYFGSGNELFVYNPETGKHWQQGQAHDTIDCITAYGKTIYFGSADRYIYSYDPFTKNQKRTHKSNVACGFVNCMTALDDILYYGNMSALYSCNPATGEKEEVANAGRTINCITVSKQVT